MIACTPTGVYKVYDRFVLNIDREVNPIGSFQLFQNYPNPFNSGTTIRFYLPERASVQLKIYDALGRWGQTLCAESYSDGEHSIYWGGRDAKGQAVASGMYFYRLSSGSKQKTMKMILLR